LPSEVERERWFELPFAGVDGVPKTGQAWVRSGLLTATIITPPNAGQAIELFVDAYENAKMPPERIHIDPVSSPSLEALRNRK
jgi:ABC-type sugar transport system substrate-binding protein